MIKNAITENVDKKFVTPLLETNQRTNRTNIIKFNVKIADTTERILIGYELADT